MKRLPKELAKFPLLTKLKLKFLENLKTIPQELFDAEFPKLEESWLAKSKEVGLDTGLANLVVNQAMQGSIFALFLCRNFKDCPHFQKLDGDERLTNWVKTSSYFQSMPDDIRILAKSIRT